MTREQARIMYAVRRACRRCGKPRSFCWSSPPFSDPPAFWYCPDHGFKNATLIDVELHCCESDPSWDPHRVEQALKGLPC